MSWTPSVRRGYVCRARRARSGSSRGAPGARSPARGRRPADRGGACARGAGGRARARFARRARRARHERRARRGARPARRRPSAPVTRCSRKRRCSGSSKWSGVSAASSSSSVGFRDDCREQLPLPLEPRLEEPRRRLLRARRAGPRRPRTGRREAGERLAREVEPIGEEPQRLLALGRVLRLGEDLARPNERLLPVVRPLEDDPDAVVEVALGGPEPPGERVGRVGRVLPLRQRDDADVEPLLHGELHPAQRRLLPRRVGVEAEEQALREPAELPQLVLGERRAHRRDDRLDPGLAERDHVGVPLDDDRAVLLRDRRPGEMEPVEDVPLLEHVALGRVDVLAAQRVVVAKLPRLEADDPPARVGEREHETEREVVVAALVREARRPDLVGREAALPRLRDEPRATREAEPELA